MMKQLEGMKQLPTFEQFLESKLKVSKSDKPSGLDLTDCDFIKGEITIEQKASLEKYTKLNRLILNGKSLTSLKNFPKLNDLTVLELNDNLLDGTDLKVIIENSPKMRNLKLANNKIESIDVFKVLDGKDVIKLEIRGNPFTQTVPTYREDLFRMIDDSLMTIDGTNKRGDEVEITVYGDDDDEDRSDSSYEDFGESEGSNDEDRNDNYESGGDTD